jgi:hypothetical protein
MSLVTETDVRELLRLSQLRMEVDSAKLTRVGLGLDLIMAKWNKALEGNDLVRRSIREDCSIITPIISFIEDQMKIDSNASRRLSDVERRWQGQQAELERQRAVLERQRAELERQKAERAGQISRGRHIVVFMDGTSNTPEELRHTLKYDLLNPPPITNVVRLMRGVFTDDSQTGIPQVISYFRGVGTEGSVATRLIDGASGRGLSRSILDAYRFISHNLEWVGDSAKKLGTEDKIFIFGFSRGAYAARALSGFLNRLGLIRKDGYGSCHSFSSATNSSSTRAGILTLVRKISGASM